MDRKALLQYSVRVAWSEEDAAFIAQSPEFRGITAFGASYGEAVTELEQALQLAVETHEEEGWPGTLLRHVGFPTRGEIRLNAGIPSNYWAES
jgi:predicted RNase H-like HicB family nuclease